MEDVSLREPPGQHWSLPGLRVGRHPAGAGDAQGEAVHAGVGRLGARSPGQTQTRGLGIPHQTKTHTWVRRLGNLILDSELNTRTPGFMTRNTWLCSVGVVFLSIFSQARI